MLTNQNKYLNFLTRSLLLFAAVCFVSKIKAQTLTAADYQALETEITQLESSTNLGEEDMAKIKAFRKTESFYYPKMLSQGSSNLSMKDYYKVYRETHNQIGQYKNLTGVHTWQQMGPFSRPENDQGRIEAIATPLGQNFMQVIYAGAPNSGIWKTTDGGENWNNISDGFFDIGAGCQEIVIDPLNENVIYASIGIASSVRNIHDDVDAYGLGIYKSTDAGLTWSPTSLVFDIEEQYVISRIIVNPLNSQQQYAISPYFVYRTLDGWNSFQIIFGSNASNVFTPYQLHADSDNDGQPDIDALNQSVPYKYKPLFDIEADPTNWNKVFISSSGEEANQAGNQYHSAEFWYCENGLDSDVEWTFDSSFYNFQISSGASSATQIILLDYVNSSQVNGLFAAVRDFGSNLKIFKRNFQTSTWDLVLGETSNTSRFNFEFSVSRIMENDFYVAGIRLKKLQGNTSTFDSIAGHADVRDMEVFQVSNESGGYNDLVLLGNDGGVVRVLFNGVSMLGLNDLNGTGLAVTQFYGLEVYNKDFPFLFSGAQDGNHVSVFQGELFDRSGIIGDMYDLSIFRSFPSTMIGSNQFDLYRFDNYSWQYDDYNPDFPPTSDFSFNWNPPFERDWLSGDVVYVGGNELLKLTLTDGTIYPELIDVPLEGSSTTGRKIQTIRVSKVDSDVIYVADDSPLYAPAAPANGGKKLFITQDGGDTWNDITSILNTPNGSLIQHLGINKIEIDPSDPSIIYLGLNGIVTQAYPNTQRVIRLDLDFNQSDLSIGAQISIEFEGLPRLPINDLEFAPGQGKKLYAATDIGIFMRDYENTTSSAWIPVSDGLPVCMVTDIEFDIYTNEIFIATFGRGLWKADMACDVPTSNVIFTEDTEFIVDMTFGSNMRIDPGVTVTIKSDIAMLPESRITVRQGGKLVLDGGSLIGTCGQLWEGITVLGNSTASQELPGMGVVELKNDARIENALCAITVGQKVYSSHTSWYWGNTGGIVKASNSSFLNNKCDVIFHPYQNFNPQTLALKRNKSFFRDCTFEVNREVYTTQNLEQRVRLNCIDGIRFTSCRFAFSGDALQAYNIEERGMGLYTIQSSYEVTGKCASVVPLGGECEPDEVIASNLGDAGSDIIPSRFEHFSQAVKSSANGPIPSTIQNTLFKENKLGIYMLNMHSPKIERNKFLLMSSTDWIEYGLCLEGCSGYKVERNYFKGDEVNYEDALYVGTYLINSGAENNEIYLNDYQNLYAGTIAEGQNGDYLFPNNGLEMLCGKYSQVKYNIAVLGLDDLDGKIAYRQGDNAGDEDDYTAPAGNLFDEATNDPQYEFDFYVDNETPFAFAYEHHNEDSPFPIVPTESNPEEITNSENDPLFLDRGVCCPKIRDDESTPVVHHDLILVKRLQIKNLDDDLSELMDGGNSQIITDFVLNPNISSAEVRMNLLPLAPFLSDQVLIGALKRSPALNPWHLCEILISCSPLSAKSWIEVEKNTTMSDYLYELLLEYQNGTNGRWTMEMEMKRLLKQKAMAERSYTYWALSDSTEDYHITPYRDLMTGDEINRSIRLRFPLFIKEGKYDDALNLLGNYISNGDDHWITVATLICDIEQNKFITSSSNPDLSQLIQYADRTTEAGRAAYSYLELFDLSTIEQKLLLPTPETRSKKMRSDERALLSDIYPNPTSDYAYLTFVLPDERTSATANIYDISGKKVQSFDITKVHGILEINASQFEIGSYLYEVLLEDKQVSNGKFVILH
jgi:hypothetical protein